MFARRSAHNDRQSFLEMPDMMPNFAGVEKFFAHKTFKAVGWVILVASNSPRAKS
jgi:hypothetical protein